MCRKASNRTQRHKHAPKKPISSYTHTYTHMYMYTCMQRQLDVCHCVRKAMSDVLENVLNTFLHNFFSLYVFIQMVGIMVDSIEGCACKYMYICMYLYMYYWWCCLAIGDYHVGCNQWATSPVRCHGVKIKSKHYKCITYIHIYITVLMWHGQQKVMVFSVMCVSVVNEATEDNVA